jgi:hypothetical protein
MVSPAAQVALQMPPEQTSPVAQAWPQYPQLDGSVRRFTQTPEQRAWPSAQRFCSKGDEVAQAVVASTASAMMSVWRIKSSPPCCVDSVV